MAKDYPDFLGALPDERTPDEKEQDYDVREIVASAPMVEWKPIDIKKIEVLFPRYQYISFSCVAQTAATMKSRNQYREEGKKVDCSASFIYQKRINKPGGGMTGDDVLQIMIKKGTTLESLMPSQNMSDPDLDAVPSSKLDEQIGQILRGAGYFHIPFDIDKIAQIMESDRKHGIAVPVMTWFQFPLNNEWWMPVPKEGKGSGEQVRHSVTAIDYGLYNGEKALVVQETSGISTCLEPNKKNLRIITQSYLLKHIILAAYETDLRNDWRDSIPPVSQKPSYKFLKTLNYSPDFFIDKDVKALQDILKYEGIFSTAQESSGYYGNYTAKCVLQYQEKHGISTDNLGGRRVGPKTLSDLNMRYGN